jgi:SAM-dependent methyltransferase
VALSKDDVMQTPAQTCNACGQTLSHGYDVVIDPQTTEHFSIPICRQCGLGQTTPQPENLDPYYGASYHGGRHGFTDAYCMWRRMRMVTAVTKRNGGSLLDFGCGDGSFALSAIEHNWNVAGVEIKTELAEAHGIRVHTTIEEFGEEKFDCITLWHSLEHVRNPKEIIASLSKRLAADGTLIIAVPDFGGLQSKVFGKDWFHLDVPRHLFHFTQKSLKHLLEDSGLALKHSWHHEVEIDLFGWTQSALNKVLPSQNALYNILTFRHPLPSLPKAALSVGLGTAFTLAALPVMPLGWSMSRGGTMVVAAKHQNTAH